MIIIGEFMNESYEIEHIDGLESVFSLPSGYQEFKEYLPILDLDISREEMISFLYNLRIYSEGNQREDFNKKIESMSDYSGLEDFFIVLLKRHFDSINLLADWDLLDDSLWKKFYETYHYMKDNRGDV